MQLSNEQNNGVNKLLERFSTLFLAGTRGFKQTHLTEYVIETVGNPIEKKPYPLPMVKMDWVHDEVECLLNTGIICHSVSPWCSLVIVFVKAKESLINIVMLVYPNPTLEYKIYAEASGDALGGMLAQTYEVQGKDVDLPIGFTSYTFSKVE